MYLLYVWDYVYTTTQRAAHQLNAEGVSVNATPALRFCSHCYGAKIKPMLFWNYYTQCEQVYVSLGKLVRITIVALQCKQSHCIYYCKHAVLATLNYVDYRYL